MIRRRLRGIERVEGRRWPGQKMTSMDLALQVRRALQGREATREAADKRQAAYATVAIAAGDAYEGKDGVVYSTKTKEWRSHYKDGSSDWGHPPFYVKETYTQEGARVPFVDSNGERYHVCSRHDRDGNVIH